MRFSPQIEPIARYRNYGDLPGTWQVPDIKRFSARKPYFISLIKPYLWWGE